MVRSPEGRDAFKLRLNEKSPDAETESVLDEHQVTSLLSYTKYTSLSLHLKLKKIAIYVILDLVTGFFYWTSKRIN